MRVPQMQSLYLCALQHTASSQGQAEAFLTRRDHLHLGAAADSLVSTVGAACVGARVPGLQVVDEQCAIWGLVDTVAIGPHRQPVPRGERTLGSCAGPPKARERREPRTIPEPMTPSSWPLTLRKKGAWVPKR